MAPGGGIGIHPQDARLWEQLPQLLLHLLGARANMLHPAAAFRAGICRRLGMSAIVAHQPPVGGMIGQGSAAPGALGHIAALAAQQHPAAAPAVQKQDTLLPRRQIFFQLLPQRGADQARVAVQYLLPQIRNEDLRQGVFVVAPPQQRLLIASLFRRPGGLHRRRSGTEHQRRLFPDAEVFGDLPGIVPWYVFRLIASLLLLVHDDEAQIFQGREQSGAGPQHHVHLSPADALPLVIALRHFQGAMEHGHPAAEVGAEFPHHLRRQHDLRHQHHSGFSQRQRFLHQAQINLRLTAAGNTVQQRDRRLCRLYPA